jgi:GxxExxY protein
MALTYRGKVLNAAYRVDFVIDGQLVLEIKATDRKVTAYMPQMLTYLRLLDLHHGLILNFNEALLRDGIKSVVR